MAVPNIFMTSNLTKLPRPIRIFGGVLLLMGLPLLITQCDDKIPEVRRQKFIAAYAEMTQAYDGGAFSDSIEYRAKIDSILATHGLDRKSMRDFVQEISGKPEIQKDIFSEIARLKESSGPLNPEGRRRQNNSGEMP